MFGLIFFLILLPLLVLGASKFLAFIGSDFCLVGAVSRLCLNILQQIQWNEIEWNAVE